MIDPGYVSIELLALLLCLLYPQLYFVNDLFLCRIQYLASQRIVLNWHIRTRIRIRLLTEQRTSFIVIDFLGGQNSIHAVKGSIQFHSTGDRGKHIV